MGDGVVSIDVVSRVISRKFDVSTLALTCDGLELVLMCNGEIQCGIREFGGMTYMWIGECHVAAIAVIPKLFRRSVCPSAVSL
jgi:hypothetical protein